MLLRYYPFTHKRNVLAQVLIILLSIILGITVAFLSVTQSLMLLAFLIGAFLLFLCITNYRLGFIISIASGFSIFIISRYFMDVFPIGWIVESLVYASFIGLLVNCLIEGESLVASLYHPISFAFGLYLVFILWQAFNPAMDSIVGWFHFFRRQFLIFLIYVLTVHYIKKEDDIKTLIRTWIFFSLLAALYAILTQMIGLPNFEDKWVLASKNRENLYYLVDGFKRKYSLYSDPAAFGMDMAATTLLLVTTIFYTSKKKINVKYLLFSILCLLGAIYSGTRTSYLMIISGLFLFLIMIGINRKTLLVSFGLLLGYIVIMLVPIYDNLFINRIRSAFNFSEDASLQIRNINRAKIQPYIHSNPIGGGVYTTGGQGMEYNPEHILAGFPPDSGYLRAALETGWIGLIILLGLHFVILRSGIYAFYTISNNYLKAVIIAVTTTIFAFVIANYGQDAFGQIPSCFLFCICIGIIAKSKKLNNIV